jgi:hypothetical protein
MMNNPSVYSANPKSQIYKTRFMELVTNFCDSEPPMPVPIQQSPAGKGQEGKNHQASASKTAFKRNVSYNDKNQRQSAAATK